MQPGGGRGDGARLGRENRLVIFRVATVGSSARRDIGRQRHSAMLGEAFLEGTVAGVERKLHFTPLALVAYRRREAFAEDDPVARRELPCRTRKGSPFRG